MNTKSGFTLTELLVAVAVMVVITSIAVGNYTNQLPEHRLEQAQWRLLSDLRAARLESVIKGAPTVVTFNSGARTYTIWTDANRNSSTDSGELVTKSLADLPGVSMFNYPNTGTFTANGTYNSAFFYTYVGVWSSAGAKYVYLFPSGQVDEWN